MGINIIDSANDSTEKSEGILGKICEATKKSIAECEKAISTLNDNNSQRSKEEVIEILDGYLEFFKLEKQKRDTISTKLGESIDSKSVPALKELRNEILLSGLEQISATSKSMLMQREFAVVDNQISYIKSIISSQPGIQSIYSFCGSRIDYIKGYIDEKVKDKNISYSQDYLEENPKEQQRQARRGVKETMRSNLAKAKKENEEMIREQRLAKQSLKRASEHAEVL